MPEDCLVIERSGYSSLHDHRFQSLLSGEAFLDLRTVSYFDGRLLRICGFHLGSETTAIDDHETLAICQCRHAQLAPEALIVISPHPLDLGPYLRSGLGVVTTRHRKSLTAELFIECESARSTSLYRRSRQHPFEAQSWSGLEPSAAHLRLVELFYRRRKLTGYLADLVFSFQPLLRAPWARVIEAWQGGRLCGFAVWHKPFEKIATGLSLVRDPTIPSVSDFLYGRVIEAAAEAGAQFVNVGPSPNRGIYNFKRKWGALPRVPPFHTMVWATSRFKIRSFATWGPRLLRL